MPLLSVEVPVLAGILEDGQSGASGLRRAGVHGHVAGAKALHERRTGVAVMADGQPNGRGPSRMQPRTGDQWGG